MRRSEASICVALAMLAACGSSRHEEPPPDHLPVVTTLFEATPAHYGIIDAAMAEGGWPLFVLRFDPTQPFGEGGVEIVEIDEPGGAAQRIWQGHRWAETIAVSNHHVWVIEGRAKLTVIDRAAPHDALTLDGLYTHLAARGELVFTSIGQAAPALARIADDAPSAVENLGVMLDRREPLVMTRESLVYRPLTGPPMRRALADGATAATPCETCRPSGERWYAPDHRRHAFVEVATDGTRGRTLAERVEDLYAPIVIGEAGVLALEIHGEASGPAWNAKNHELGQLVFTQLGTARRGVLWDGEVGTGPHALVPTADGALLVTARRIARIAWR